MVTCVFRKNGSFKIYATYHGSWKSTSEAFSEQATSCCSTESIQLQADDGIFKSYIYLPCCAGGLNWLLCVEHNTTNLVRSYQPQVKTKSTYGYV